MFIHRILLVTIMLFISTANHALESALRIAPVVAGLIKPQGPQQHVVTHLPTTTGGIAQTVSAELEQQIINNLDVHATEADILKMAPKTEHDIVKARIALQRSKNTELARAVDAQLPRGDIERLIKLASINARVAGVTPLIRSLRRGSPTNEISALLLENRADVTMRETETPAQMTPLHVAASTGNLSMTQLLVEKYKADEKAKTVAYYPSAYTPAMFQEQVPAKTPRQVASGEAYTYLYNREPQPHPVAIAIAAAVFVTYICLKIKYG